VRNRGLCAARVGQLHLPLIFLGPAVKCARLRQAGVTDDVPLHLLAGNVLPMAKGHHMTTVDVRNSSLVLVVAVPKDNAAFPAVRAGQQARLLSPAAPLPHGTQVCAT